METEIRRINNSEIQSFKWCRRNWYFNYFLNLEPIKESTHTWLGSLFHKYKEAHNTGKDWRELIPEQGDKEYDVELSVRMMEGYVEWLEETGADAHLEAEMVEEKIEYTFPQPIMGRTVVITTKMDRLLKDSDGILHVEDTKTVQNLADMANPRLRLNEQLLTYVVVIKLALNKVVADCILDLARKVKRTGTAKPPFYERVEVTYNETHLNNHYHQLRAVIEDIFTLEDRLRENPAYTNPYIYPTVSRDCTWKCPFIDICPLVDDGSNFEWALENLFKEREYVA